VTPVAPGLAAERTALAWRRTVLALAVGSLAAGRVLQPALGGGAWPVAVVGVVVGLGVLLAAGRRAAAIVRALSTRGDLAAGPAAGLLAALAVVAVLVGVVGLVVVVRLAVDGR